MRFVSGPRSLMIDHRHISVGFTRFFLLAVLFSFFPTGTVNACPLELPTTSISINGHILLVELAATYPSRACGLSHRAALKENQGMLFVYPQSGMMSFWMKDTRIPLSIAFLDDTGRIINIEIMSPDQTDTRYRPIRPALYALEVNQGWFRLHGINVGDRVEMKAAGITGGLNRKLYARCWHLDAVAAMTADSRMDTDHPRRASCETPVCLPSFPF